MGAWQAATLGVPEILIDVSHPYGPCYAARAASLLCFSFFLSFFIGFQICCGGGGAVCPTANRSEICPNWGVFALTFPDMCSSFIDNCFLDAIGRRYESDDDERYDEREMYSYGISCSLKLSLQFFLCEKSFNHFQFCGNTRLGRRSVDMKKTYLVVSTPTVVPGVSFFKRLPRCTTHSHSDFQK